MEPFYPGLSNTLGAFGFPDNKTEILHREKEGARALILKGCDHMGRKKQMAMTVFAGWQTLEIKRSEGANPDSEKSLIPYASVTRSKQYGYEPYVLISQVISREDWEDFPEDDLFPIRRLEYTDKEGCGGYGPVVLHMEDGGRYQIDFDRMEGSLML